MTPRRFKVEKIEAGIYRYGPFRVEKWANGGGTGWVLFKGDETVPQKRASGNWEDGQTKDLAIRRANYLLDKEK